MKSKLGLAVALCLLTGASACAQGAGFAVRDVRVFDGHKAQAHKTVLVSDGRILRVVDGRAAAPPGFEVVNGEGRTLLPGLIDAHVHVSPVYPAAALRQSLRLGVTTDLDMFASLKGLQAMKAIEASDPPDMADVRTAGIGATTPGGHPTEMGGDPIPTISGPDEAERFVEARIAEGSDYIKIIYEDCSVYAAVRGPCPSISAATLRALVVAAHRHGKLAVVHISSEAEARDAIAAGADGLAHIFIGKTATPDFGRYAAAHHVFVEPTLTANYDNCGRGEGANLAKDPRLTSQIDQPLFRRMLAMVHTGPSKISCDAADQAVREMLAAHVPMLVGTDSPAPGSTYGASTIEEIALLVRDGLTPTQALTAATFNPAHAFHLNDRGEIRAGLRADLLLVQGDPTRDVIDLRNIVAVWKRGVRVQRLPVH
ncbi:hypothetical protein MBSD_n1986 [Mizugakiibacter sediminis]|uniref:Amidohydrolase-related domain-containing protein n=1 Tax=Mizugakiibacter sediminis TaxID=1475481 RepID=A0A0K8QP63_9GAMM|nr:amidohydrolase family protein [Mizugakiibacter sediminis]GAP66675.1 hypothetical protein MBSD_n1986 [Mizugakiibacter sediminis]